MALADNPNPINKVLIEICLGRSHKLRIAEHELRSLLQYHLSALLLILHLNEIRGGVILTECVSTTELFCTSTWRISIEALGEEK
jgi:hypothetical protein